MNGNVMDLETEDPSPEREGVARIGLIGWSVRFGIVLPILYYFGRRFFYNIFPWDLPMHSLARQGVAAVLAAVLVALLVAVERRGGMAALAGWLGTPWRRRLGAVLLLPLAGAALYYANFYDFSTYDFKMVIPGDGREWLRIADEWKMLASEPLGLGMHHVTWLGLRLLDLANNDLAVRLSSVLAGVFFLAGALALAGGAYPGLPAFLAVLFLFVTPVLRVFTGYPETSPWAYAFAGVYLLAGLRYVQRGTTRPPWPESILLMLAIASHGMACFMMGAQAVLLGIWLARQPRRGVLSWITAAALAVLPLMLLAGFMALSWRLFKPEDVRWYGNMLGGGDAVQWVRFGPTEVRSQYVFLSPRYIIDLVNILCTACPLVFIVPIAVKEIWKERPAATGFLLAGLTGQLCVTFFWNADLGMQSDYDLLSLFTLPATMLIALWWSRRLEPRRQWPLMLGIIAVTFVFMLLPYLRLSWAADFLPPPGFE